MKMDAQKARKIVEAVNRFAPMTDELREAVDELIEESKAA
jgi:hypothetical protein